MKKLLILLGFFLIVIVSFGQKLAYETKSNIQYYNSAINTSDSYINERCLLDLYYPKNSKGFATIVWFHGGGLTGGNKEIPEALKDQGFAIIGVNYRLSPKVKAEKCIEDAAAAVAWAFNHIAEYGGDTSLLFVSGHSAGGYLTTMIGLDKKWLQKETIDANKIAGLIPFSGQCITHFEIRRENGIPETQPTIDTFAPLFYVRADAPPLLLITGDRELEMLGRYEENAYLARMMKIAGHKKTKLFELDGYGHGMTEPGFPLLVNEVNRIIKEQRPQK
ncbi:alpha/beta hydrolase [Flavobacterium sp. Fl-77]|uniref:Alpha/beta hydrolase n=1 Tax=Flavobacterium flavipigmentatum TaxID=2893884 RepID=A0AAJ2SFM8_9FLAO|nr:MULTISPECIES: alpha/beta hydrolase [unclassified Flavobacterium]MDX6181948.1 alpha/beta hydrolase [Flavobacterium sp. Fl-33]MDX6186997.1 alpha/beta hydrolase [Flavobacterium sp. Fl-77]UFH37132.1 alpha/beta hydrolase [Flavobacterium sp. F-70]